MVSNIILDIEGTICPISFVKDVLFPYFLQQLPALLDQYQYPLLEDSSDPIKTILLKFPQDKTASRDLLHTHIKALVDNDVKDSVLKELQGLVWAKGYHEGTIKAPLYQDAIQAMYTWSTHKDKKVYIYSSGSVQAQKLLLQYVRSIDEPESAPGKDLNELVSGYFDTTIAGPKIQTSSYSKIAEKINSSPNECLFLSDNPKEVAAALEAGMQSYIVVRPGNAPVESAPAAMISTFDQLEL
ncbi:hypothetical protein KL905_001656 [Ogataea polymorpha]|uniref:uncharacterized protein n=1 Tax=Ogataea polymorpha TaxID=460523 RepID=UPI0007F3336F|nr:uncharacterized protein OGAPODRAFT_77236 [Ogataea polymorpha]KAG7882954.1 hypothetical protein KL937_000127 [Ogataea polymorpha]KAG7904284.1 hypothetical protein KL935_000423 [Ogataea polymorpha]KAG7908215.1 hypothetical protein KL907_001705 [Ogataea polymorpha]KAG7921174.1 hypothetical protein KL927_000418 [Ogataea polymorpha]KAG7922435.1 hypothetical protein KL905_001656 [Ogataea polymorpha]